MAEAAEELLTEEMSQVEESEEALIPVASQLKERAEAVLNEQGYSLSMVVEMFLGRVISEGGIPAGIPHPPLSLDVMTPERFAAEIQKGLDDIKAGRTISWEELKAEFSRNYGIRI